MMERGAAKVGTRDAATTTTREKEQHEVKKETEIKQEKVEEEDEEKQNFMEDSQYSEAMKNMNSKNQAVSAFAKNRTIKEQREYLPIYQVREALLKVVRENQIVVIVGETGSGKTTQMTQYLAEAGSDERYNRLYAPVVSLQ